MKLSWIERLFSFKDVDPTHRQLCVLGVRIKLRRHVQDMAFYHDHPIEPRKVLFYSDFGACQCSPKYIAEELQKRGSDYDLVWVVESNILHYLHSFPQGIRLVMRGTAEAMYELATARVWVKNERMLKEARLGLRKRPGQVYINTWHGSLGIKKTGGQRDDLSKRSRQLSAVYDAQLDYLISNAAYTTKFYREMFFSQAPKILEYGCPRNDIFFRPAEEQQTIRLKVCKALGLDPARKILLWAPTIREDNDLSCLSLDTNCSGPLAERFGGEWNCVARLHHYVLRQLAVAPDKSWLNASRYPDMQELLVAADALVTDYSSCIYDFLLTRRPGFIYAPDRKKYEAGRGLCYPLAETPFPVAETNEQLAQAIRSFDEAAYRTRVEEFLRGKGSIDDGHASARVADLIEGILDGKEVAA